MLVLTTKLVRQQYVFGMDRLFMVRNIAMIVILSIGIWYGQWFFDRSVHTPWLRRVGQLVVLVGSYACVLLGVNYKSLVQLWQEVRILQKGT
jgi:hypothetical protein